MTYLNQLGSNYIAIICLKIFIFIAVFVIILILTKRSFFGRTAATKLAQLNKLINDIKANFMKYKLYIEKTKYYQYTIEVYNLSGVPISRYNQKLLDFDKTLIGKLFNMFGSLSVIIIMTLRVTNISETILSISGIKPVLIMIAMFGSVYSFYFTIHQFYRLKRLLIYIIKGHWIVKK